MNRKFIWWVIIFVCCLCILGLAFFAIKPVAKAKILVRDDDGPVSDAQVIAVGLFKWEDGNGVTDQNGIAQIRFQSFSGVFDWSANKPGYYPTMPPRKIAQFEQRRLFSWSPWPTNVEIVIRKIGRAIPMYAKDACAKIEKFGELHGYDLFVGDWVAPYGAGKTNDFIFEIQQEIHGYKTNETMRLTFSNPGDGIQPFHISKRGKPRLPIPGLAPKTGYRNEWTRGAGSTNGENTVVRIDDDYADVYYYFRVRTTATADGGVTGGFYGKIYDGIIFDTEPDALEHRRCSPGIHFIYFLNPDGSCNTEYSGQNLLTGEGTDVRGP